MSSTFSAKAGYGGTLEGAQAVRLEAVLFPDALDRAQRQADRLGHRPAGPMGGFARRFGAGQGQHLGHGGGGDRRFARRPALVAQQTLHPGLGVSALPAPHRRAADPGASRHLDYRQDLPPRSLLAMTVDGEGAGLVRADMASVLDTEFASWFAKPGVRSTQCRSHRRRVEMPVEYHRDVPAALPMSHSTQTGSREPAIEPLEPKRRSVFLSTRSLRFF